MNCCINRWLAVLWCVLPVCLVASVAEAKIPGSAESLRGRVVDARGEPVAGATVMISTARPKVGVPTLCPSCYLDCGRKSITGESGHFMIEGVDPSLLFSLVGVGDGYTPTVTKHLDPGGDSIEIVMQTRPALSDEPGRVFSGRLVNLDGQPVGGAIVTARMYIWGAPGVLGPIGSSDLEGADRMVMTRADGGFELGFPRALRSVSLRMEAQGCAPLQLVGVDVQSDRRDIEMGPGAIVRGRLIDQEGEPVAGRAVGLCGADRSGDMYIGNWTIGTDAEGWFVFTNLPPSGVERVLDELYRGRGDGSEVDVFLYSMLADATTGGGSFPISRFKVPGHGETHDVGTLRLGDDDIRIAGRIVTTNGSPIPEGARLLASRQHAWDHMLISIDESRGRFDLRGFHAGEPIGFTVNAPGYRLSVENPNYHDSWQQIVGLPAESALDFIILIEPGDLEYDRAPTRWGLSRIPLSGAALP